jgi:hypothetical protein
VKKQFAGSGFGSLGYAGLCLAFAIVPLSMERYPLVLILTLVALIFFLQFAYAYRIYIITDEEFYISNLFGTKIDGYLFDEMIKIYTSRGIETVAQLERTYDSYEVSILKIQMKNGEIFKLNLNDVWNFIPLIEALREKLGEHMFHPDAN